MSKLKNLQNWLGIVVNRVKYNFLLLVMRISIVIPSSSLVDETTLINKTRKISQIARSCAIFQVDTIYIYHENIKFNNDYKLMITVLRYLDTPQFLRKRLFPKLESLKYVGILNPLKIPSHYNITDHTKIKTGNIMEGLVINKKRQKFIYFGNNLSLPYFGKKESGKRITIKFSSGYPNFSIKEITHYEVNEYWGYNIKIKNNLFSLLSTWYGNIILTSRKGTTITKIQLQKYNESKGHTLVVFGTINKGLYDILGNKIYSIKKSKILNFFPKQATETIRLEEAILGILSILNIF